MRMAPRSVGSSWSDGLPYGLPTDFDYGVIRTPADARVLMGTLPNRDRGAAARGLYERRLILGDKIAYEGLMQAWDHDHDKVLSAFGHDSAFAQALRQVSLPSKRKRPVRAWRGVADLDAAYGVSWTTDRDTACWFAMRYYERHQTPFVFFCDLNPLEIVAEHNGRRERELLVDPHALIGRAILDVCNGDTSIEARVMTDHQDVPPSAIADWRLGFDRVEAARKAEHDNRLAAARLRWSRGQATEV